MKKILLYIVITAVFAGCKKDNFEAPSAGLSGRVVYQNQPLSLRSGGVQLELWQHGFELFTKIPVFVAQDGTFSASLFGGAYKLVLVQGNGPWINNTDSIDVNVNGNTTIDVPVEPYFIITNESFQKSGTDVTATFTLQSVNTSLPLESVSLFLGQTIIVDAVNNAAVSGKSAAEITDITQPITLSVPVPTALLEKGYVFARVGIKTSGVAEMIYTIPQQIQLQ